MACAHPCDDIEHIAWLQICNHFASPEFQMRSESKKRNMAHLTTNHCTGSRPFVRVRHHMRDLEAGQEVDSIALDQATHFQSNDDWSRLWSLPQWEQNYMVRCQDKHLEHTFEDMCSQVLGTRSGYVKVDDLVYDEVPRPSQSSQLRSTGIESAERLAQSAERRAESAERRIEELERTVEAQKQMIDETGEHVARLDATLQRLLASLSTGISAWERAPSAAAIESSSESSSLVD